jgi:ATP-dependent DNA helicase RecG
MPSPAEVLQTPLRYVKGVGPRRAADLEHAGLSTVEDLLCRFPIRYEDRGRFEPIAALRPGEPASIAGEITSCGLHATRRPGFKIFEALVRDASGAVRAVWLNQPFLRDVLAKGQRVVLFGSLEWRNGRQLTNPQYEILKQDEAGAEAAPGEDVTIHTGRIVPIYEKAGTLTPKMQRTLVYRALQQLGESASAALDDPLPKDILRERRLPDRLTALRGAHFPDQGASIDELNRFRTPAQLRLIFEEFFLFQAGLVLRRRDLHEERKPRPVAIDDRVRQSALAVLPFRLTGDQKGALKDIVADMQRPQPMNRLLQGEVGSGKTIVALIAALVAMENGLQVAFMAPTEILADQHYMYIRRLLERSRFRVALLTGATPAKKRRELHAELAGGSIHLVVGTHALVQDPLGFRELGLAIIDEQHRFGVLQRAGLRAKGLHPDVLVMTATPIPRTLALTTYGDLDVSVIREMPPGRHPIKTVVKPEGRRDEVYRFIRSELERGRQAYVVYPLIEESAKVDLKAATEMADHLAQDVFPEYTVALLHGRMKEDAKDRVMGAFARGDCSLLVSTTVVEVGVDVPNASVMLVEHAERFGLAQLHQLRGRVGRGPHQSHCVLVYQAPLSEQGKARLKAIADTTDGFLIAERDLELRGPGDFFGTRQSGMPTLRVGDLLRDHPIMEDARREASAWLDRGQYAAPLVAYVRRVWEKRFGLGGVG